jgi:AbrB family looped-hinge helix DNA binding protein
MKTTIDAAGRIVIPKDIRKAAGLAAGSEVEIDVGDDGKISIQVAPIEVKLVKRGRVFVMVPTKPIATKITTEKVNAIRDALRERRIR